MSGAPKTQKVRARDVRPYRWAVWCRVVGGEPHANTIVYRYPPESGGITFGLDSHTFFGAETDEELDLIPHDCGMSAESLADIDAKFDAENAAMGWFRPACLAALARHCVCRTHHLPKPRTMYTFGYHVFRSLFSQMTIYVFRPCLCLATRASNLFQNARVQ